MRVHGVSGPWLGSSEIALLRAARPALDVLAPGCRAQRRDDFLAGTTANAHSFVASIFAEAEPGSRYGCGSLAGDGTIGRGAPVLRRPSPRQSQYVTVHSLRTVFEYTWQLIRSGADEFDQPHQTSVLPSVNWFRRYVQPAPPPSWSEQLHPVICSPEAG